MRNLVAILAVSAVAMSPLAAQAGEDMNALKLEAIGKIKAYFKVMKGELQSSMKTLGPAKSIDSCSDKSYEITQAHSTDGWIIARTSLKIRNPGHLPDAWETKVLNTFEQRKAKGEDPMKIAYAEVVEEEGQKVYRFMKAISIGEVCLHCHGTAIKPEVTTQLDEYYPEDKARGYKLGDLRGAFTLKKPL